MGPVTTASEVREPDLLTERPPRPPTHPFNLFAVPLGITGLGGAWQGARATLQAPAWPAEVFYGISAGIWSVLVVWYLAKSFRYRSKGHFDKELRHPGTGPSASFIPLVGILLSSHYIEYNKVFWSAMCLFFIIALTFLGARLLVHWVTGGVTLEWVHPGYLLPVAAGPFIASIGFSTMGWPQAAVAAWGPGGFVWLMIGTGVTVRFMAGIEMPDDLKPVLAGYLAAPATALVAWIVIRPEGSGIIQLGLTGILFMMILMQVVLIPQYASLPFSLTFWIFTFPVSTSANYGIRWLGTLGVAGSELASWALVGLATAFVLGIGIRTLVHGSPAKRRR
jgi:tellurite resistance protein